MLKDFVIVVAGGGVNTGLKNAIMSFKIDTKNGFDKPISTKEFPESIPIHSDAHEALSIFCACIDATTFVFELNPLGSFAEIYSFTVSETFNKQDYYQTFCKFLPDLNMLCTGMTDGALK